MAREDDPVDALVARVESARDSQSDRVFEPWLPYTVLIPGAVAEGAPVDVEPDEEPVENDYSGWALTLDTPGAEPEPESEPAPGTVAPGGFQINPDADLPEWLRVQQEQARAAAMNAVAQVSSMPVSAPALPMVAGDVSRAAGRVSVPRPDEISE
ncbi:MAG: hypothetical protein HOQ05_06810 [Corynebacteriales bacterium]|nr:hypothetical protein [Mycobacteriales bacterium]